MQDVTFYEDRATSRRVHAQLRREREKQRRKADPRPLRTRLADAMIDMAGAGQTVDMHALLLRGFKRGELTDENIAAARDRANGLIERTV